MSESIKLVFSGDFVPVIQNGTKKEIFDPKLVSLISTFDMHITNLECPLTNSDIKIKKSGPHLKSVPASVHQLNAAKVNTACLANNHIFDYGEKGLLDTIDVCEQNGIDAFGIVNRYDKKHAYLVKEINGKKICLLNYCESEFSVRDKNEIGANGIDAVKCYYEISKARRDADYLIVIYHGGNEMYPLPNPHIKKLFHFFIDVGADAVINHHTHVFSGIEHYNSRPIVYGLGNFVFNEPGNDENWCYGLLAGLTINEAINLELFPIEQCIENNEVNLCPEEKKNKLLERVNSLSQIILDDKELEKQWQLFADKNRDGLIKTILSLKRYERFLFRIPYFRKKLADKDKILSAYNLFRCESLNYLLNESVRKEINSR